MAADVAGGALRRVPNLDIASLHHHDCKALSQLTLPFLEHRVFPSDFGVKIPLPFSGDSNDSILRNPGLSRANSTFESLNKLEHANG